MIIGLVLTIMLLFLGPQLLRLFNLDNYEVYTAKNIFVKIGDIVRGVGVVLKIVAEDYPTSGGFGVEPSSADWNTTSSRNYQL